MKQNQLQKGSHVNLCVAESQMIINLPRQSRYELKDLMNEMPAKFPLVEDWDEMKPVGKEVV